MKILEIIPNLGSGGAERFVVDLCNELSLKNEVTLVILQGDNDHSFFMKDLSERVKVQLLHKSDGPNLKFLFVLFNIIIKEKPDIVHTHLQAIVYTSLAFVFKRSIKYIHTVHNDAAKEAEGRLGQLIRKFAFGTKLVHPVTISNVSQNSFTDYYGLSSTLIENGRPSYVVPSEEDIQNVKAEIQKLKVKKESKVIVNVARIQKQKNQLQLAKAIKSLNELGHNIELFIIGGKYDSGIISSIEDLHTPYVHLLGERVNPRDYMFIADAFSLSSVFEGMPISLIECFSTGTIPLCTPVGGIKNIIQDNINGLLSSGTEQKDLEDMFIRFLRMSVSDCESMCQHSKETFPAYSMTVCSHKYHDLFERL